MSEDIKKDNIEEEKTEPAAEVKEEKTEPAAEVKEEKTEPAAEVKEEKTEPAAEVKEEKKAEEASETKSDVKKTDDRKSGDYPRRNDSRPQRSDDNNKRFQKVPRFKKKVCRFCHSKDLVIDYKKSDVLAKFITDRGKILPRRVTGTCAKHQRLVATEIKRARMIALLPFVEK